MKTLKRTLVLLLVLAMSVSLFSVAAFAKDIDDFTDADKINEAYKEAVDVMVGIDVIDGISDTIFDAQGNFTREQAAKIIAYLKLGTDAAKLTAASAPFSDVPAGSWSAGYIAYCAEQGIIDGRGDGTFDPYAKLTDTDFAKMLLCAVGYGVNDEYTGNLWYVKVQSDARAYGVFEDSLAENFTDAATREECVLYAFNTLSLSRVIYVELLNGYNQLKDVNNNIVTLADNFNLKSVAVAGGDAYGRDTHKWQVKGVDITDAYADDDADFTAVVTEKLAVEGDYEDFLADVIGCTKAKLDSNIVAGAATATNGKASTITGNTYASLALEIGDKIELYKDDNDESPNAGKVDKIVIIRQDLVRVTSIVAAADDADNNYDVSFETWANGAKVANITKAVADTDMKAAFATIDKADYARNMTEDYYFFATIDEANAIIDVTIPEVVTGSATAKHAGDQTITVNSKTYPANAASATVTDNNKADVLIDSDVTYNFYVSNGAIISYVEADNTASDNYAYVLGIQASSKGGDLFGTSETAGVAKAKIVTTDGKVEVVDLPVDTNAAGAYVFAFDDNSDGKFEDIAFTGYDDEDYKDNVNAFCSYTIDKDGNYKFSKVTGATAPANIYVDEDVAAVKDAAAGNNLGFATKDTVLTVVPFEYSDVSPNNFTKVVGVTTYTGYANFPAEKAYGTSADANTKILLVYNKDNTAITNIYVFAQEDKETTTNYALYLGPNGADNEGSLYKFLVNGEVKSYYSEDGQDESGAAFVASTQSSLTVYDIEVDSDNYVTATKVLKNTVKGPQDVKSIVAGAYFTYNDGDDEMVSLADDCIVIDASNSDTAKWAADSIAKEDKVVWILDGDGEKAEVVIIIDSTASIANNA